MRFVISLLVAAFWLPMLPSSALAQDEIVTGPTHLAIQPTKTRAFILTDIGNEPDDQMSLVRLLLYSNEIEIEGLVATTSTWQRAKVSPSRSFLLTARCSPI
jgi:hypothetical protein